MTSRSSSSWAGLGHPPEQCADHRLGDLHLPPRTPHPLRDAHNPPQPAPEGTRQPRAQPGSFARCTRTPLVVYDELGGLAFPDSTTGSSSRSFSQQTQTPRPRSSRPTYPIRKINKVYPDPRARKGHSSTGSHTARTSWIQATRARALSATASNAEDANEHDPRPRAAPASLAAPAVALRTPPSRRQPQRAIGDQTIRRHQLQQQPDASRPASSHHTRSQCRPSFSRRHRCRMRRLKDVPPIAVLASSSAELTITDSERASRPRRLAEDRPALRNASAQSPTKYEIRSRRRVTWRRRSIGDAPDPHERSAARLRAERFVGMPAHRFRHDPAHQT